MEHCFSSQYYNCHPSSFNSCTPSSPINRRLPYPIRHNPYLNSPTYRPESSSLRVPYCTQRLLLLPICKGRCSPTAYPPSFVSSPLSTPSTVDSTPTLRHRFYDNHCLQSTTSSSSGSPAHHHLSPVVFPRVLDKPPVLIVRDAPPNRPTVGPTAPQPHPPVDKLIQARNRQPKIVQKEGRQNNEEAGKRRTVGAVYYNCPLRRHEMQTATCVAAVSKMYIEARHKHLALRRKHRASSISSIESLLSLETRCLESVNHGRGGQTTIVASTGAMAVVQKLRVNQALLVRATKECTGGSQEIRRLEPREQPMRTQRGPPAQSAAQGVGEMGENGGNMTPAESIQQISSTGGHMTQEDKKLDGATRETVKRPTGSTGADKLGVVKVNGGAHLCGTMKEGGGGLKDPPRKQSDMVKSSLSRAYVVGTNTDDMLVKRKTDRSWASRAVGYSIKEEQSTKTLLLDDGIQAPEATESVVFKNLQSLQTGMTFQPPQDHDNPSSPSADACLKTASATEAYTTQPGGSFWTGGQDRVEQVDGLQKDASQLPTSDSGGYNMGKLDYAHETTRDILQGVAAVFDRTEFCFYLQPRRSHFKATPLFSDGGPVDTREPIFYKESPQSQNRIFSRPAWELTDCCAAVRSSDDCHQWVQAIDKMFLETTCEKSGRFKQTPVGQGTAQRARGATSLLRPQDSPQTAGMRQQTQQYENMLFEDKRYGRKQASISECFESPLRDDKLLRDVSDRRRKQRGQPGKSCAKINRNLCSVGKSCEDRQQDDNTFRKAASYLHGQRCSPSCNEEEQGCRRIGLLRSIVSAVTEKIPFQNHPNK
eukprot:GHVS01064640.1.p1 GENE.GHVS01064640.1~~GHVS01064640.1.p1  ORF type:complete len:820 (-),score=90.01 GHVS01064640.1:1568-4027(-)